MKQILNSTTALLASLSLLVPVPSVAQDATDPALLCADGAQPPCAPGNEPVDPVAAEAAAAAAAAEAAAQAEAAAAAEAEAAAQAQAEAEAAAAAEAAAQAEAAAAEAARAEAEAASAAQAEADAKAAAEAAEAAAAEAAAEADAKAAAEAAEAEAAAAAEAAAQAEAAAAEAAAKAEEEAKAADAAAAEAAAQAEADAKAAAEAAAAEAEQPVEAPVVEAPAAEPAPAEQPAEEAEVAEPTQEPVVETAEEPAVEATPEQAVEEPAPEQAPEQATEEQPVQEPVAEPVEAEPAQPEPVRTEPAPAETAETGQPAAPVEPPVVILEPVAEGEVIEVAPETAAEVIDLGDAPTEAVVEQPAAAAAITAPDAAAAQVTTQTVTEETARSSNEEFATKASGAPAEQKTAAQPQATAAAPKAKKDDGLSDLEKAGLVILGALVVGAVLKSGDEVVSNTGDRVVLRRPDGTYRVLKDDDTLLRRPGSTVQTETFTDGSTRTTVTREDGTRIVTIRDQVGRILRRSAYDPRGIERILIDDTAPVQRVDVTTLPEPRRLPEIREGDDLALRAALIEAETKRVGRTFSLRQVRDIPQVRRLAPEIDQATIVFETGSSAVRASQAERLSRLGNLIRDLVDENPGEIFLIEGHTDAVGSAASNLALSDRRAESVALALTEYYGVPPENLVVQGYGESDLLVQTDGDEPLNRRTAARRITGLLNTALR